MVRCQKYLEIIQEECLIENAERMGIHLLMALNDLQFHHPSILSNARGAGLMCAIDFPSSDIRDKVRKAAYDNGMLILGCGEKSLRFRPTLNISMKEIDEGIGILEKSLLTV